MERKPFKISDDTAYLQMVVKKFRSEAGQFTGFELKKKLWRAAVVVAEIDPAGYRDWQLTLAEIAFNAGIDEHEIITTVMSARRKAGVK